jgi:hypothetical protein
MIMVIMIMMMTIMINNQRKICLIITLTYQPKRVQATVSFIRQKNIAEVGYLDWTIWQRCTSGHNVLRFCSKQITSAAAATTTTATDAATTTTTTREYLHLSMRHA